MTGRERVIALLDAEQIDRLPCMPITMMFAADQIGVQYRAYATDYHVLAEGQIRTAEKFAKSVEAGSKAVCCSALLTTTMPDMKSIVERFKQCPDVKVVVGGAPVTQAYANDIGAHGFATNASDAVKAVAACLGVKA